MSKNISFKSIEGKSVQNNKGESLGMVRDMLVNTQKGHTVFVLVVFRKAVNIAEKLFVLPLHTFTFTEQGDEVSPYLNIARKTLEEAEGIDPNSLPGNAETVFSDTLYDHLDIDPLSSEMSPSM
jgi:sporulation protein YlmC with PRC-barrel domain